ncbi:conjugal transfer protein [Listeria monocytogenes]|nr:conjugal transfer protein [Listeria monocytogenes]EDP7605046.1 conjugal transfer protein [Listeria monocytogenes]EEO0669316.1 conjugal transfer protein [Listeria monocytogenes]EEO0669449.1 conjugal transfer protein [Listeria monocytogenes]EEO9124422.1 conjugal transfer protein [Listeria monocytogenes]
MNKEKQLLDYREPFNAPYMIREIAKNVHLPFVVYAQDFTVATVSFALSFSLLLLFFGMNQLVVMVSIAIPYGLVQLFNRVEPDGKRADIFLKDYLAYLFTFAYGHKSLYHEQLHSFRQEKVIYHRCTVKQLVVKTGELKMNTLDVEQLKQEIKAVVVPELIYEFDSLNAQEEGFYELFETDDEVLLMKKTLFRRYDDGIIPINEIAKLKEQYQSVIKQSIRKRITRLL